METLRGGKKGGKTDMRGGSRTEKKGEGIGAVEYGKGRRKRKKKVSITLHEKIPKRCLRKGRKKEKKDESVL